MQTHLLNRKGVIVGSDQTHTTIGRKTIKGSTVEELLPYPSESKNVLAIIARVLDGHTARYYSYSVDNTNYITLFIPALTPHLVEAHEIQFNSWDQRMAAILRLEEICHKRWRGPGCAFGKRHG